MIVSLLLLQISFLLISSVTFSLYVWFDVLCVCVCSFFTQIWQNDTGGWSIDGSRNWNDIKKRDKKSKRRIITPLIEFNECLGVCLFILSVHQLTSHSMDLFCGCFDFWIRIDVLFFCFVLFFWSDLKIGIGLHARFWITANYVPMNISQPGWFADDLNALKLKTIFFQMMCLFRMLLCNWIRSCCK